MTRYLLLAMAACCLPSAGPAALSRGNIPFAHARSWGEETLDSIEKAFRLPSRGLYAEEIATAEPRKGGPAMNWSCGVQLSALAAAARVDPGKYGAPLDRFVKALDVYRTQYKGIDGYDVLPAPKPPDRYYDDNEWIVLALLDAYAATGKPDHLSRAEKTFKFVMSGEDDTLGGGIYWHEIKRDSKNTCSNAPAAAAAFRLFRVTKKPEYRDIGMRLYEWTNAHLQDSDGLYFDNVKLDGTVDRAKFSYNSALMIRANCELHAITSDAKYLREAERIARAAEAKWFRPETGAMADDGAFAHLLLDSFLALYEQGHDAHWTEVVAQALDCLHRRVRDPRGFYPKRWDRFPKAPLEKARLLDQASAARAYWSAAGVGLRDRSEGKKSPQEEEAEL